MPKERSRRRTAKNVDRYAPATHLLETRAILVETGGATVYQIAKRLDCSIKTARRYLDALGRSGEALESFADEKRLVYRLAAGTGAIRSVKLTTAQMIALCLSRRIFDFLSGTGFKEEIDEVFKKLEHALSHKDFVHAKNLDKKLFDLNEAPIVYDGRAEDVNDLVTALIREDKLDVTYGQGARKKDFLLWPLTLVVYKKGLYLVGHSEAHGEIRTFSLDGFSRLDWKKGVRFDYPKSFDPAAFFGGAFGMIKGERAHVRIRFDETMDKFVSRRRWHPTQRLSKEPGATILEMDVDGTTELRNWILSFGSKAEVLAPPALVEEMKIEAERMVAAYEARARR